MKFDRDRMAAERMASQISTIEGVGQQVRRLNDLLAEEFGDSAPSVRLSPQTRRHKQIGRRFFSVVLPGEKRPWFFENLKTIIGFACGLSVRESGRLNS